MRNGMRRWVAFAAALGVLVHAVALVRHNTAMLDARAQLGALLADLASICNGGADDKSGTLASFAPEQGPLDVAGSCPICMGQAAAFALAAPEAPRVAEPARTRLKLTAVRENSPEQILLVRPSARDPPAAA